jgi:cell division protein FtsW
MTSTISVGDRRRAALERLHGGVEAPRRRTATRRAERTRSGERRSREPRAKLAPEVLGPPPGTFYAIAGVVSVLVMLGLVMVLSASAVTEANLGHSPYRIFAKQAMWAGLGLIALVAMVKISYRRWQRLVLPIVVLAVAAMAAPFAPGIGASVNGARSWVRIGPLSVQPSEFLKIAVVIVAADLLTRRREMLGDRAATLFPLGALATIGAGLCLVQGDLGAAVVLGAIVFSVAWVAGVPVTPLSGMAVAALGSVLLFVVSSPRRLNRFTAFMNIAEEKDHLAYQTYQGYLSMASGGLSGSGIGGSNAKLGYLPYAHSDFIFAVIADELGLIGTVAVIGGFAMLVALGVQTAIAAPDRFGMLLAGGIAAWFGVQAIVNIGGVVGFMPVTGLTLPFFSAGGSSLFVSMTAAGLLLSVARRINAR